MKLVIFCFVLFSKIHLKKHPKTLDYIIQGSSQLFIELIYWDSCQPHSVESECQQTLASLSLCLMCISKNSSFFFSRLNSIDVKYQMWKLGVVFTDNVSPFHYHKVKFTLMRWIFWVSADRKDGYFRKFFKYQFFWCRPYLRKTHGNI